MRAILNNRGKTGEGADTTRGPLAPYLRLLYDCLFAAYGPQHWWPAESPFEVMAGAILTQSAAWSNV